MDAACVTDQSNPLADARLHLLSWIKDAVGQESEYSCQVTSKAGNRTSKTLITVEGNSMNLAKGCILWALERGQELHPY